MNTNSVDEEIKCLHCGFMGSGKFCSQCGKALTSRQASVIAEVLDSFFKISEIRLYISTYWNILRSPTSTTLQLTYDKTYHRHLSFLLTSIAFFILIALSRIFIIDEIEFVAGLLTTLYFFLTLLVTTSISYKLLSRASNAGRSLAQYVKLIAIALGFTIPLAAIVQSLLRVPNSLALLFALLISIPLIIYIVRVLRHFWALSTIKVFLYWLFASLLGNVVGSLFVLICSTFFNIQIQTQ